MSEQPSLEQHCSPPQNEERARKGAPIITCSSSPWLAYRSRRGPFSMQSKQKKKQKKHQNIASWNARTLIDLIDLPLLSLLNLPGTKSTLPPLVNQAGKQGRADREEIWLFFFWSGRALEDKHEVGVDYAIKTSLVGKLACAPERGE